MGKTFGESTDTSPQSNNDTSSEFEILSPPNETAMNESSNLHLQDLRLSVNSAHFDLLPEEIQIRLRELLNENLELKETLHENNTAMSEQFSRLSKWQKEVELVQEQNKMKFEESRQLINNLHEENMDLNKQLGILKVNSDLSKQNEKNEEIIQEFKKEIEKLTVINLQLTEELKTNKELLEQVKLTKNRLISEKQDLLATNNDLQTQLRNSESSATNYDISTTSVNDEEQSLIIVQQTKKPCDKTAPGISSLVTQLQLEQQKMAAVMAELMEERKMKSLLISELTALKEKSTTRSPTTVDPISLSVTNTLEQKGAQMLNTIKETELKLAEANRKYTGKTSGLEDRLTECQERLHSLNVKDEMLIVDLKSEIEELRGILALEQAENKEDKVNLNAAHSQFENLLQDYQQLLHSWESYEHEQAKKGVQSVVYYDIQIKSLKEEIDRLTAQLLAHEETVAAKIEDNNQLRLQNRMLSQELEKVPILQAQLEIYQTDFRMERESSEKLGEEKEQALRQVHQLEARCEQLVDELETYRRVRQRQTRDQIPNCPYDPHTPVEGSSNQNFEQRTRINASRTLSSNGGAVQKTSVHYSQSAPANRIKSNAAIYYCPKCNMGFNDLQPLQNHVEYCLENNF